MSSFVWMRVLESAPERYDRGVRMLAGGWIEQVYDRIAAEVAAPGQRIVDVGCGTGGVSLACAARGAQVLGLDLDAGMLEVARSKPVPGEGSVAWVQASAAELEDHVEAGSVDAVVSCLAMSEMSTAEQDYLLNVVRSRLVPAGRLLLADEALPTPWMGRLGYRLARIPRVALTYALTQTTTRPVQGLADRVRAAGFTDVREERPWSRSFVLVLASRGAP